MWECCCYLAIYYSAGPYITHNGVNAFTPDISGVMIFLLSFISLNIFIYILDRATLRLASGRLVILSTVLFFYNLLYAYHYRQKNSFDYSILADNASETFTAASFTVIVNRLNEINICIAVLLVILFVILHREIARTSTVSVGVRSLAAPTALYMLILVSPFPTYDEGTFYFKSAVDYYRSSSLYRPDSPERYPLIRPFDPTALMSGKKKNVFLVIVESFNGNFIERRDVNGREYTPYFNSLLNEGIYVENYYSNSIQTARSQFAIFCSVIPSFRRKEFTDYGDVRYYSIAQALKDNGYRTAYTQAYKNLGFDNTGVFLKKNGFSEVETLEKYKKVGDENHYTSWG